MRNMRKILSTMSALGLVTVAGTSTVACQNPVNALITMNNQVKEDLGLISSSKESEVEPSLAVNDNVYDWNLALVRTYNNGTYAGLDATALLQGSNIAKSTAAYDFLKDVLRLTPTQVGTDPNKAADTFDNTAAANIVLAVTDIKPTLTLKSDNTNYNLTGGYVAVQWKDKANDYVPPVNTYGGVNKITIKNADSIIPDLSGLKTNLEKIASYTSDDTVLKFFKVSAKNDLKVGDDIFSALKNTIAEYKDLDSIAKSIGQKVSFKITKFDGVDGDGNWSSTKADNKITFDVMVGEAKILSDYALAQG